MSPIVPLTLVRNGEVDLRPPSVQHVEAKLRERLEAVVRTTVAAAQDGNMTFRAFESLLRDDVFAFARASVVLFLALCEERISAGSTGTQIGGRAFRPAPAQARNLTTTFGVVRYWRLYMREVAKAGRRGFHPLDVALGLTADRLSMSVLALSARLATKLAFAEARATLSLFMPSAPSVEVIEHAVLGFGRRTQEWFIDRPAPTGDGDTLIIMIDSKGAPTVTIEELRRRRGPRPPRPEGPSPRHRGRGRRKRHPKKARKRKSDKSKNANMATMVVMYTLKRAGDKLLGPINRFVYASFAPKEHAFVVAQREAGKRGFGPKSGKTIQLVTDGDDCLARNKEKYFPSAIHTVDVIHIIERLWDAGGATFREGTAELKSWVELQKQRLYEGRIHLILDELRGQMRSASAARKKRLGKTLRYMEKRIASMNYKELLAQDLEIATGPVEGAVKNVIGKRCDHGGMRWIKERAEAVLQLRCIEINGDWDAFIDRVHDDNRRQAAATGGRHRLQVDKACALPTVQRAA